MFKLLCRLVSLFVAVAVVARADSADDPVGVAVKIWARGTASATPASLSIAGTFLPQTPGGVAETTPNSGNAAITAGYTGAVVTFIAGSAGYVRVEPDKTYTLFVNAPNIHDGELNIMAPPGYRVVMDHMWRSRETFDTMLTAVFELQPVGAKHPGLAGVASALAGTEIEWVMSLGALRNGDSAGELSLIDTGMRNAWDSVFTPSALYYESTSDEIWVYRKLGVLRQIRANQVVVDIVALSSIAYEIRCYQPAQERDGTIPGSDEMTFVGQPYITYRVEKGTTDTSLQITKETRNITDIFATNVPVARAERTVLTRAGAWPNFEWTRTGWTVVGQAPVSESFVQSGGSGSARSETILVRVPGSGTPARKAVRNYSVPIVNGVSVIGEVLSSETVGTNTGLSASFDYYTDPTKFGSFGYLKSTTFPGGGWAAYEYYDSDLANGFRGGKVKYRFRPYINSPASVSQNANQGEVTYYQYTQDVFGALGRLTLSQTKINGTLVGQVSTSYNDSYGAANGSKITETTRQEYTGSGYLTTIIRAYRDDADDAFVRGQTHSQTNPDGTKVAFAYQRGSWNGGVFSPSPGSIGVGDASRVSVIAGTTIATGATQCTSVDGYQLDPLYIVDGKSTKQVTIRDYRALVVRTENYAWKSNAWVLFSYTDFTYDAFAHLVRRVTNNGATYTAVYDGDLKASETDEAGVTTAFTYDVAGRLETSTQVGVGAIPSVSTKFLHDAAGETIRTELGWDQPEKIVNHVQFDDAGRPVVVTPPGNYGVTTHTYSVVDRSHTVTNAEGGTTITAKNLDGTVASVTGTATIAKYYTYGVAGNRPCVQVNLGSANSARWEKTTSDWLGRVVQVESPGFTGQPIVTVVNSFDSSTGQLRWSSRTGYAPTVYQYNSMGQIYRTGLDYDSNYDLNVWTNDRVTETDTYYENYNGAWWLRTDTKAYPASSAITTSTTRKRLTGHPLNRLTESQTIDAERNLTTQYVDVNRAAATSVATTLKSGIAGALVERTVNGVSVGATGYDGLTVSIAYDSLLRRHSTTDSRGNTTITSYVANTDLVQSVTNAAGNAAVTSYDALGRTAWQRDPKNFYTRYAYNLRGQITRQWGDGTMPVEYGYEDTYGDRVTMATFRDGSAWEGTTWPSAPGASDWTRWEYDAPSGLLKGKYDAANLDAAGQPKSGAVKVTMTYNLRGQVATRTLARGVSTTYNYNGVTGELLNQTYSDGTPTVSFSYLKTGQVSSVHDVTGDRTFYYSGESKFWRISSETESSFYNYRILGRQYDESAVVGRVTGLQLGVSGAFNNDLEQRFGFSATGRFASISTNRQGNTAPQHTFRYGYLANSAMLQSVALENSPFTITRGYEAQRDVITSINSQWGATSRTRYDYAYDERGMRKSSVQSGDAFADYGDSTYHLFTYNGRGEVTGDIGYLGGNVSDQSKPLPGRRYTFAYDNAGNRRWSDRTGVDANNDGLPDLRDNYVTNSLNQYVSRENNTIPVSGTAASDTSPAGGAAGTSVAVKGRSVAAGRQGRYWNDEITVANTLQPWRGPVTIFTAKRGTGGAGDLYRMDTRMAEVAAALQNFTYDADGNLKTDGLVDYSWDGENRLARMQTSTLAASLGFPNRAIEFLYDYLGRRVEKRIADLEQSIITSQRRYLYDGWNLVAEYAYDPSTATQTLVRSYTWGLDIALSMTNAGGVGALLQIADHPTGKTYVPTYDGNGNIASLLNADTGALAAVYEYSPFGETLRAQTFDATIADNPWRFSTKWTDLETGLIYYGHRYYDPRNGRFINRDPIEESGGLNLYGFCLNNSVNGWDVLGHGYRRNGTTVDLFTYADNGEIFLGSRDFATEEEAEAWGRENEYSTSWDGGFDDSSRGVSFTHETNVYTNGVFTGTVSGSDLADFMLQEHEQQLADARAARQAVIDQVSQALNASTAQVMGELLTEETNQATETINAGITQMSGAAYQAANDILDQTALPTMNLVPLNLPPTGTVTIGEPIEDLSPPTGYSAADIAAVQASSQAWNQLIASQTGGGTLFQAVVEGFETYSAPLMFGAVTAEVGANIFVTAISPATTAMETALLEGAQGVATGIALQLVERSAVQGVAAESALAGSARSVNPFGGETNCVNCARVMDARLAGVRGGVAELSEVQPISSLGSNWVRVSGQGEVEQILANAGRGSRGIVFGQSPGQPYGHVWNAVNQKSGINFIDAQAGTGGAQWFDEYAEFLFLRTH